MRVVRHSYIHEYAKTITVWRWQCHVKGVRCRYLAEDEVTRVTLMSRTARQEQETLYLSPRSFPLRRCWNLADRPYNTLCRLVAGTRPIKLPFACHVSGSIGRLSISVVRQ